MRARLFLHGCVSTGAEGTRFRELNLHAMRLGPGKHLRGLTLMNGLVTPEEVWFFSSRLRQVLICVLCACL